jgi:hypothetical protein
MSLLNEDSTMYDVLNNADSAFQYGAYLVALCQLIQEVEIGFNEYFKSESHLTFSLIATPGADDPSLFCDSPLAFGFGLYTLQVQLICDEEKIFDEIPTWKLPLRATFGFKADIENDWAIQHFHESINFEAILAQLIDDILDLEVSVNDVTPTSAAEFSLDTAEFDAIVSTLDSATAANFKEQMVDFL